MKPLTLAKLSGIAKRQLALQDEVERLENAVKMKKHDLAKVAEEELPDLMEQLEMQKFTTTEGFEIKVDRKIFASIRRDNEDAAYQWLRDHGKDAIIKTTHMVSFGKGENEASRQCQEILKAARFKDYKKREAVHPSTLKAFIRDSLKTGVDFPLDIFGAYEKTIATIKKEPKQ